MADPSASVSPQLLHHLHALCVMKYPLYQSLQPELLVDMLLKTPVVVQQYPFAWSMIEPPPPGSLMLSWHPPAMGTSCASDGYVWADPENVHTVDVKGYVCLPRPAVCCTIGCFSRHIMSCVSTLSRCMTSAARISRLFLRVSLSQFAVVYPKSPPYRRCMRITFSRTVARFLKKYNLSLCIFLYLPFIPNLFFLSSAVPFLPYDRSQPHYPMNCLLTSPP